MILKRGVFAYFAMYLDDEGVKDEEDGVGGPPEHHGGGLTWPRRPGLGSSG